MSKIYTEHNLIKSFIKKRESRYQAILPNVHTRCWESDILTINKTDYVDEFEIKCTKADFTQDFNKGDKHERLIKGDLLCNRFWFYMHSDLIELIGINNIPDYCGILSLQKYNNVSIIRNPKRLHKDKISEDDKLFLCKKFVHRYNNLRYM